MAQGENLWCFRQPARRHHTKNCIECLTFTLSVMWTISYTLLKTILLMYNYCVSHDNRPLCLKLHKKSNCQYKMENTSISCILTTILQSIGMHWELGHSCCTLCWALFLFSEVFTADRRPNQRFNQVFTSSGLSAEETTAANYTDGPWESCSTFNSVSV